MHVGVLILAASACTDILREYAWYGDATHHLDVRMYVSRQGVSCASLERCEQRYVSNCAQAEYWLSANTTYLRFMPVGSSCHSLGTAFEANYYDSQRFRHEYIDAVLRTDHLCDGLA